MRRMTDMPNFGRLLREKNIIFVTLALCVLFYLISPRFLSLDNMSAISRQIPSLVSRT